MHQENDMLLTGGAESVANKRGTESTKKRYTASSIRAESTKKRRVANRIGAEGTKKRHAANASARRNIQLSTWAMHVSV